MSRPWSANLDMYRRVPTDLLEGTKRGSLLSVVSVVTMVVLFLLETKAFFSSRLVAEMSLDENEDARLQINFNITMMDMACEYATIDIKSDLGTEQNITHHINKWAVDAEGVRQMYKARNKHQHDIAMYDESVTETLEELHEDGEDAISLDPKTLTFARNKHEYVFVDFFASWCSHCRDLAPTWETLAEVMDIAAEEIVDDAMDDDHHYTDEEFVEAKKVELPVFIGKVDCVEYPGLCREEEIRAYPTLRLFVDGKRYAEYNGHRTVIEMVHWLSEVENKHKTESDEDDKKLQDLVHEIAHERTLEENPEQEEWAESLKKHRHVFAASKQRKDEDHPGCQITGLLNVDRSPGNFHIIARSKKHQFDPKLTNVSHEVHHLSFGWSQSRVERMVEYAGADVPGDFFENTHPLDGNVYVTKKLHEAHHHYLKVITTNFENKRGNGKSFAYQFLPISQLSLFPSDTVPEAKFAYDLSPLAISYKNTYMNWYDYVTSVMAIVGGTFTIVGLLESGIHAATSKKNR